MAAIHEFKMMDANLYAINFIAFEDTVRHWTWVVLLTVENLL